MNKRQWQKEIPQPRNNFILFGTIGFILVTIYPTMIHPMLFPTTYKKLQAEGRKGINQEEIQPGNMKVWSDPFARDKK